MKIDILDGRTRNKALYTDIEAADQQQYCLFSEFLLNGYHTSLREPLEGLEALQHRLQRRSMHTNFHG